MKFIDLPLSMWRPVTNSYMFRPAPRDPVDRDPDYEDRFDYGTIIFDAFWSMDGTEIIAIAPPTEALASDPFGGTFREVPSGRQCDVRIDRTGPTRIVRIAVSPETRAVRLDWPLGSYFITPQPNHCDELAGHRLLMCHSKDNALHWVRDWAYFYVKNHGATGLLFYNNRSTRYSTYDLRAALATVPGLEIAVVIDADVPFGAPKGRGRNDSKYFQRFYQEQGKYRLFAKASSLLHVDIDELVVSPTGESIFTAVEGSEHGYINFVGEWIERVTEDGIEPDIAGTRHALFYHVPKGGARPAYPKSAVAPSRLDPDSYVVTVHMTFGPKQDGFAAERFTHKHFMGIKDVETHPNNERRLQGAPFEKADPELHQVDEVLKDVLERTFGSAEYRALPDVEPFATASDPDIARRLGGECFARGDYAGARDWALKAIALAPDRPSYHQFLVRCYAKLDQPEAQRAAAAGAVDAGQDSPKLRAAAVREVVSDKHAFLEGVAKLAEEFPNDPDVLQLQGDAKRRFREPDAAIAFYRAAIEAEPANIARIVGLSRFLTKLEREDELLEVLALIVDGRRAGYLDRYGAYRDMIEILVRRGRVEEARATAKAAMQTLRNSSRFTEASKLELESIVGELA